MYKVVTPDVRRAREPEVLGREPYDPGPMNTEPARASYRVLGSRLSALRAPAGMTRQEKASPHSRRRDPAMTAADSASPDRLRPVNGPVRPRPPEGQSFDCAPTPRTRRRLSPSVIHASSNRN